MKVKIKFTKDEFDICDMSNLVWEYEAENDSEVLAFFLSDLFKHISVPIELVFTKMHEHIGDIDFSRLAYNLNESSRQELKKALDDPEDYQRKVMAEYKAFFEGSAQGSA